MSEERPGVVLALTPVAERAIEALVFGPDAPLTPLASAAEADELERLASEIDATAALISPGLSGLTPGHCARIRAAGLRVVGLALDERERQALDGFAADEIVDPSSEPDAVVAAVRGHADDQAPVAAEPESAGAREPHAGSVLAVVGGKGAPGASECAASLAAIAFDRWPTILVELDALGGDLDVRLGGDAHEGSLLGVLRAAGSDQAPARELVERWLQSASGWPPVLLGPPDLDRALPDLAQPGAIAAALHALSSLYPVVICDAGFLLAEGAEATAAARVHRDALVSADAVLLVLGAREAQLRHGLRQLDLLLTALGVAPERLRVVVNGAGAPGAVARPSLEATLASRLAERGLAVDGWLAWDRRALTRADRLGVPLARARPRGAYARSIAGLLDELFLPTAPEPKRRKRRLQPPVQKAEPEAEEEVALPWR